MEIEEINYSNILEKNVSGKIKIKSHDKANTYIRVTLLTLIVLTIVGFLTFDYKNIKFFTAALDTVKNIKYMFTHATLSHVTFIESLQSLGVTISLAFLTTIIGSIIALFLSLFAAKNLTNGKISNAIKCLVAFIRAVPTVLWILIFAVTCGLGSESAIIGMAFHTIGYLTKVYSESFEEMDGGIIEALKASGATFWQIVCQAVIPTSLRYILVWTFLRFEINFTNAVAMGAVAGAGGIGFELFMSSSYYYDSSEVGFITIMIFLVAMTLEFISTRVKKKIKN
ncbi:MAG: ABC transporter permease subunit [Clostridiales bacterium]|nr:ABC transporter permease subunit [Clostridiales bacterium]